MTSETNQKTSSVPLPGDTIVVSHCWIVNYNKTEQPVQMNQNDDQVANIHLSRCSAAINDHIFDSIGQQKLPSKKRKRNFENDEDKEFPCVKRRKLMFQKCARNDDNEDEELPYLKKKVNIQKA
uniref:Uncharacterized protein n=1 Tax=Sipha flava TaxID=143950 RepID=A0A2S2QT39_9HEMI